MSERKGTLVNSIRHRVNGGTLTASIFSNEVGSEGKRRYVFNVSLARSWHDGKEWQDTKTMRVQDLPALALVSQVAYLWCQNEMAQT
ncbi:MAG: hypothetical protein AAF483_06935 [Planctomycetota bacterium]